MKVLLSLLFSLSYILLFSQEDARFRIIENNKIGYINNKGQIIIKPKYANGSDFHDGVAAVRDNGLYGFIDINGNYIIEPQYDFASSFRKGFAVVFKNRKQQLINLKGELVDNDGYKDLQDDDEISDSAFYGASQEYKNNKWGIVDSLGNYLIPHKFDKIDYLDQSGFINGMLKMIITEKLTYIDKNNDIIWQEKINDDRTPSLLNIDFMNRGYCYAYSKTEENNGWGMSDNYPKTITSKKFPQKQLSLIIDKNEKSIFNENFEGCKLYLANTSGKKITFNASNSRLNILLQAMDEKGDWQYIEYAPSSWCGNSYHNLYLDSGEYWDFTIPVYEGSIKTKIRAVLSYYKNKKEIFVYSNIIEGSVNPAQFFNKRPYTSNGIMDPYDE